MAFKIWDGFDHYAGSSDFLARSGFLQWQFPSGTPSTFGFISGLAAGGAGKALNFGAVNGAIVRAVWGARNAEFYFGVRVSPIDHPLYFVLQDTVAGSPQVTILFNPTNFTVQIFRGSSSGTSLYLSANNVWNANSIQFVEVHAKIDPSAGEIVVRIAGVTVASVTGANTQATANAWSDALDFSMQPGAFTFGSIAIDDLYYLDTATGSGSFAANTFAGDCRVATLFATGNQSVQWTPLSGTNWQEVSETAFDGDTSYNSTSTAGQEDLLAFAALTGTLATIYGIQLTGAYRKDDAGSRIVKQAVKSSSTEVYGSDWSLTDTYAYYTDMWILDPNTSANWTAFGVNAAYYGYNLVS